MNQIAASFIMIFGALFAVVLVVLALPYLAPYAGSASGAVVSTGNEYTNILPWIGVIVVSGGALLAMERGGKLH